MDLNGPMHNQLLGNQTRAPTAHRPLCPTTTRRLPGAYTAKCKTSTGRWDTYGFGVAGWRGMMERKQIHA